jgi:hypothetical protein
VVAKRRGLDPESFVPKGMLAAYTQSQRGGHTSTPYSSSNEGF